MHPVMQPRSSASHPPPSSADISGLLDGLDAADFDDDFDELPSSQPHVHNASPPEPDDHAEDDDTDEFYEPPAPLPANIPTTVSFATGRGKQLARPSDAAMSRALKLVRAAERDAELEDREAKRQRTDSPKASQQMPGPPESPLVGRGVGGGFGMASGRPAPSQSEAARARALALFGDETPVKAAATPAVSGFQLGSGSAAPPPPADARTRAIAMFGEDTPARPQSGFQLGSGSSAPPAPADARARALAMFGEGTPVKATTGFQTGSGASAPPPSADARARALALFGEDTPPTPPAGAGFKTGSGKPTAAPKAESMAFALALLSDDPSASTVTPQRAASPAFVPPLRTASFSAPARTPSRTPLTTMTNTFTNPMSTPKLPKRINIQTPGSTPRRIGLGAGLGSARGKPKKGFVTPFKRGAQSAPGPSTLRTPLALRTPTKPPGRPKIYKSVFDLTPPSNRKSMRDAYFYPDFYTPRELAEAGLPDEIWTLDLTNAVYYQFIGEDARVLGTAQALEQLKLVGCELATLQWVDNHWRLILWKVAGQVMAQPKLFDDKWNWYEVLCQLRYRYEREYGAAQRPIVRRIQEHDSSPSLPMVLCVAAIHRPGPVMNERDEPVPQKPYLDLTDGWYIIRALLDDCLARALAKGKIRVGRKLGLSGAKLESGADGAAVLEAYEKSHLVLSGNSTHLAKWDARLGLQRVPFIAGLSSLSVDGGPIVLMDIVIDRVFALAYMNADRGSREPPWNEEEEHERSDVWQDKYEAERTRLGEEMQKGLEKIQEVASILASHAEDVGAIRPGSPPDVEADFDALMETRDIMGHLRSLSSTKIVHLATYARQRAMAEAEAGHAEIQAQLSTVCPPRAIRNFRMVRVRDGREGVKEPAREAMLNVWDAKALGNELKEGRRFLVSNILPGRAGDWAPPRPGTLREVYLHTRPDTRWQPVEK